jgi:hypothetical protein
MPFKIPKYDYKEVLELNKRTKVLDDRSGWISEISLGLYEKAIKSYNWGFFKKITDEEFNQKLNELRGSFQNSHILVYTVEEVEKIKADIRKSQSDETASVNKRFEQSTELVKKIKDECNDFTTQEVNRIITMFSESSGAELSNALGKIIDDRIVSIRENDAKAIAKLEVMVNELEARLTKLESLS